MSSDQDQKNRPAILRLLSYGKGYRMRFFKAGSFSILNKIFDIFPEILIGIAIDVVVARENSFLAKLGMQDPWDQIQLLGLLTLFVWFFESLFEYLYKIAWRGLAQSLQHDLRQDTYEHIQNQDLAYFEDQSTGNLVTILNDDINQLERFLDDGINQILHTATAVIGVGAVFFVISVDIALLAFVPIPIVILGGFYFQKKATNLYGNMRSKAGDIATRLSNNISGIVTIKSFTSEIREAKSLTQDSLNYMEANRKAIQVSSAFIPIIRMAILAGFMATFLLGGWKVLHGELNIGLYGLLVFLTQRLLWPLTGLAATFDLYERAMASTRRVLDLLNTEIHILPGSFAPTSIQGQLRFENVSFQYASGPTVLKELDLNILANQTTAFAGSTGSGKSTLVKLLMRFYDPQSGCIQLDGTNLYEYDTKALRSHIGLVSQDVFLFHGSIFENIAYGKPDATVDEVQTAARLAEIHEFIISCDYGYDCIIGERGLKLSGGQRQRISLARAIIKDPHILILDEATSAVDNETEAAIQRSIEKLAHSRTTIIIAHRLSTIVNADIIHVLEQGQIVESGTHAELIQQRGAYRKLWDVQTGQHTR